MTLLTFPSDRRFDILAIGEPLYELTREPDGRFRPGFGGDTSNVAVAASRLGARVAYATQLGEDMFGDAFAALWEDEGVDASLVLRRADAPTGVYLVTHGPAGHSFTYLRKGSAASLMAPSDSPSGAIAASAMLHVSGISQAISASAAATVAAAIETAKDADTRVSFDTNYRPRLWPLEAARPTIHAAAARCDLLKTSLEDGQALTGLRDAKDIARFYLTLGASAVAVTLGSEGALAMTAEECVSTPPCRVVAVDATGAGDAFMGALLAEMVRASPLRSAVAFANAAAALSTRGLGAVAPLPRRAEVEAAIAAWGAGTTALTTGSSP